MCMGRLAVGSFGLVGVCGASARCGACLSLRWGDGASRHPSDVHSLILEVGDGGVQSGQRLRLVVTVEGDAVERLQQLLCDLVPFR